jgi:hypothetical protein
MKMGFAMKNKTLEAYHENLRFVIEEDFPEVGAYLYVFQNNKCIRDYLQNDVETCQEEAFDIFGVPISHWRSAS